jgi:hypothetical protein
MASTTRSRTPQIEHPAAAALRWRSWPLKDRPRWSWLVACGLLGAGAAVWFAGGGWLLGVAAIAGLAGTLWQFLLPVRYEVDSLGVRRSALRRSRLIPWHSVRAYQLRPTGVVLYQRVDPTKIDLLRSVFVPYPGDEDELLCAMREHLPHAVELPQ